MRKLDEKVLKQARQETLNRNHSSQDRVKAIVKRATGEWNEIGKVKIGLSTKREFRKLIRGVSASFPKDSDRELIRDYFKTVAGIVSRPDFRRIANNW